MSVERLNAAARSIGHAIGERVPKGAGFLLLIFDFSETGGDCAHISNARREDMIRLLREHLAHLEKHCV